MHQTIRKLSVAATLACSLTAAHGAEQPHPQLRAACGIDAPPGAALPQIAVRQVAAAPGDLPYYEARSSLTGSSVRIYHDPELADAVASKIACFMGMLDLLPAAIPDARREVAWSPMVITRNASYIPPKRDGELRWLNVFGAKSWDTASLHFLLNTMPHEETHFSQKRDGVKLPRWFEEGHAEWAGLQVTAQVRPDIARDERARRAADAAKLGQAGLGAWGGISVKPEAIERQLSAEDRARKAKDPSYNPPGPFRFGPGDFVKDDGNEEARYGAALAVFDGLEQRHGRTKVLAWVSAVLDAKDPKQIALLAQSMLGEDIGPLLR